MTPIIILGIHRSGTSVLSHILHQCGVHMGSDFLISDELNQNGYYEDTDFLWLNKAILECAGGSWVSPPKRGKVEDCYTRFQNIFQSYHSLKSKAHKLWGWKDPRNILTCWFYKKACPEAKYIVVRRKKQSCVTSMRRARPDSDVNWSHLYDQYNTALTVFLRKAEVPFMEINYEELIDPRKYLYPLRSILIFAGLDPSVVSKAVPLIQFKIDK